MTGIASAQEHGDTLRSLDRCPQCGIEEGARSPITGKKLPCIPIAEGVRGVGIVCWCSETCRRDWLDDHQVRLP